MPLPVAGIRIREAEGQRSEGERKELGGRRGWHSERKGMGASREAACAVSFEFPT